MFQVTTGARGRGGAIWPNAIATVKAAAIGRPSRTAVLVGGPIVAIMRSPCALIRPRQCFGKCDSGRLRPGRESYGASMIDGSADRKSITGSDDQMVALLDELGRQEELAAALLGGVSPQNAGSHQHAA